MIYDAGQGVEVTKKQAIDEARKLFSWGYRQSCGNDETVLAVADLILKVATLEKVLAFSRGTNKEQNMDVNLNADPDFRHMVRNEVKAALIGSTKIEVTTAIQEGIRRAVGNADAKIPGFIQMAVKDALPRSVITDTARQATRELVREHITLELKALVEAELKKLDVAGEVRKRMANLRISIVA